MTTTSTGQTVYMTAAQIAESGDVLGRAFFDDPLTTWVLPDDAKRAKILPWFFAKAATVGHRYGEVYTTSGTTLVKDILPGASTSSPTSFVVIGGVAYFVANDGVSGSELWRTDGTESGTTLVADICPGATGSAMAIAAAR